MYDDRVGGGFPKVTEGCSASSCTSGSPPPPTPAAPASLTFSGIGNYPPVKPVAPKALTKAQQLAKALKACRKSKSKARRHTCEAQARKKYGKKAKRSARVGSADRRTQK